MDMSAHLNQLQTGSLPDFLRIEWTEAREGIVRGRFTVERKHMAPNGFLHAASVVALADSACGYGCRIASPPEAIGFTTIEIKTNYLGTTREGVVSCDARLVHGGRMTQVWDAVVASEAAGKTIALFRCTQMLLYPKD
ncbi:MAG: PaaI family thioesterase [Alphaproteobacteria bacterium]|nr:PaaI family thioesterase [Alphaproteobacteria bacterium]